ncbi:MAG: ATP-grasp domain-containing protein [Pseudomonadota bacterium]
MNVLITSAGAKVLLVEAFTHALGGRGDVFTADISEQCAAAAFSSRHFALRRTDDPSAAAELVALCRDHDIRLVVPTRDGELEFLSALAGQLSKIGTTVLVAAPEVISLCLDKAAFAERITALDLTPVPTLAESEIDTATFPLFVRPVTGAGARGARYVQDAADLARAQAGADLLIHPVIDADEYSVDLLMGLTPGEALQAVVRRRTLVVAGEAKVSQIVDRPDLAAIAFRIGEAIGLVGHNVVQVFDDPRRGPLVIEANARFGGASNLSIVGGLDSPSRLLALLDGDRRGAAPRDIQIGLTMHRFAQDTFMPPNRPAPT